MEKKARRGSLRYDREKFHKTILKRGLLIFDNLKINIRIRIKELISLSALPETKFK